VLSNTPSVAVANSGAVLPGVRSPWATPSGTGANYALVRFPVPAIPAMTQPVAVMAAALPIDVRKHNNHKTRVNAGGDGASGPHPEREPA
jgi:hypothetical protein